MPLPTRREGRFEESSESEKDFENLSEASSRLGVSTKNSRATPTSRRLAPATPSQPMPRPAPVKARLEDGAVTTPEPAVVDVEPEPDPPVALTG